MIRRVLAGAVALCRRRARGFVTARQFERLERIKANRRQQALEQSEKLRAEMVSLSGEMLQNRKCEGCGVDLQASDNTRYGYIPPERLAKLLPPPDSPSLPCIPEDQRLVCMRCYFLEHYNKLPD
jgi:hypothetical protein